MVSFSLSFIIFFLQKKYQSTLATMVQERRIHLSDRLLHIWDNVVLGNTYSKELWKQDQAQSRMQFAQASIRLIDFQQFLSFLTNMLIFLPIIWVLVTSLSDSKHDTAAVLVMVGILPRVFAILNATYSFFLSMIGFPACYIQLKNIVQAFDFQNKIHLLDRIQTDALDISCNGRKAHLVELEKAWEACTPGRWCIKGHNGAGKSTLLLVIKAYVGEGCFLLPTAHQLTFASTRSKASSGQRMHQILQELLALESINVLLLDEWDASLDRHTQLAIDQTINERSKEKLIIEVRHHQTSHLKDDAGSMI